MEHTELERAEARVESILKAAATEVAKAQQRLQENENRLQEAKRSKRNAAAINDAKGYADAATAIANAEMEKEFLNERLNHCLRDPLIDEEEYERMLDAVYGESGAYVDAEYAEIGKLLLSLEEKRAEIVAIEERTDKVLRTLQQKIWRPEVPEEYRKNKEQFFVNCGEQFIGLWAYSKRRGTYKFPEKLIENILNATKTVSEALQEAKAARDAAGE